MINKKDIRKDMKVLYNDTNKRKIVVFPMVHVAKEVYYEGVKTVIDSLRKEGYVFFYEGLDMKQGLDSVEMITYRKKLRKFLGFNLGFHENNASLPSFYYSGKYQIQDYRKMGITKKDLRVDLSLKAVVDSFESRYFDIKLNECDLNTGLNAKYKCKSEYKKYRGVITQTFRNQYICRKILDSKHKKLAVIYGKAHWWYIYPSLRDNGYQLIQGSL